MRFTYLIASLLVCASASAAPRLLICYGDSASNAQAIATNLNANNDFAKIDLLDCTTNTPTLTQLMNYDGVFTWDDFNYQDRAALGNVLADYTDAGGGVVLGMFGFYSGYEVQGRWSTDGYSCITTGSQSSDSLATQPLDPNSPLVQGVTTFHSSNSTLGSLANGATSVWSFASGHPAIATCSPKGHLRVDLGFYPVATNWTGDGWKIMRNALLFVSHGLNPLQPSPSLVNFPSTGTFAVSNPTTITFTNTSSSSQTVTALALAGANPGDFLVTQQPTLPATVAAGGTIAVAVAFAPQAAGARSAQLQLTVQNQMAPATASLTGTAVASSIKVTPFPIAVGGTQIGSPITTTVHIANGATQTVLVNSVSITAGAGPFTLSNVPALPVALAGGGGFDVTVTFSPSQNGLTSGTFTVTSNDPNSPTVNIPMSGYAGPPAMSVSAGSLAFPSVNLGATSTQPLTISNTGFSDLQVTSLTISGANPSSFSVDGMGLPGVIGAQSSHAINVTFAPATTGNLSATLTIVSNAGTSTVGLFGTGTTATLGVSPTALDFGAVPVKKSGTAQSVVISNSGTGTLKISSLAISGPDAASFAQSGGAMAPFTVPPNGGQIAIPFDCTPMNVGSLSGTLTIAADVGQKTIPLTCTGTAAKITVTPNPIDFGMVPVSSGSSPTAVTITNAGTDSLTVNAVNIVGMNSIDFTSTDLPTTPLTLAPNGTATFHVTFKPQSAAAEKAEIDFASTDPLTPTLIVPLSGTGVLAKIQVTPGMLKFVDQPIPKQSAPMPVTITNTGALALTIQKIELGGGQDASAFQADSSGGFMLMPGESKTVNVTFQPSTVKSYLATLTTTPDQGLPVTISLSGNGVAPKIAVSPTSLDFGPVRTGMTSAPIVVGLKNVGTQTITIAKIASTDPAFSVDTTGTQLMLAPNVMTTFQVTFTPPTDGAKSASITLTLAGDSAPVLNIAATGTGASSASNSGGGCAISGRARSGAALPFALALLVLVLRRRRR